MWVKIDDHVDQNTKIAQVGPLGFALWTAGLAYCNRTLTDGFIPWTVARSLLAWEFLAPPDENGKRRIYKMAAASGHVGLDVSSEFVIDLLLYAGLWEVVDGGYEVHDYKDFQPTRAQVEADRESGAERMRRSRERRREEPSVDLLRVSDTATPTVSDATCDASCDGVSDTHVSTDPCPVPDPVTRSRDPDPAAAAEPRAHARASSSSGEGNGTAVAVARRGKNGRMLLTGLQADISETWDSLQGRHVELTAAQLGEAGQLHDQAAEDGRREVFWEAMNDAARGGKPWTWFIEAVKGRLSGSDFRRPKPASNGYRPRAGPGPDLMGRYRGQVRTANEMTDEELAAWMQRRSEPQEGDPDEQADGRPV